MPSEEADAFPAVPLMDLCDRARGITYGIVKVGEFIANGIPVVRGGDIRDNRIRIDRDKLVTEEVSGRFKRTILRGGEIVLNLIAEPGHSAIVPASLAGANVTRDVAVIPVAEADADFVNYFLQSPQCVGWLRAHLQGSVTLKINLGTLAALPVPLPPIDEQRRIATVLSALDDKIDSNRHLARLLEETAATLFRARFVDFVGVEEFEDSGIGRIPRGWRCVCLADHVAVLETGGRPRGGVAGIRDGVPSIGAESVVRAGVFDFAKTKFVPEDYYASMRRGRLEDRDVLLYKDGGRPGDFRPHVSMVGEGFPFARAAINEHVYRVRLNPPYSQDFLYLWLQTHRLTDEMRRRGTGVAIPGINTEAVKTLPILEPKSTDLTSVQAAIAPPLTFVLRLAAEAKSLAETRDVLLPRLISGKIRVPDTSDPLEVIEPVAERLVAP